MSWLENLESVKPEFLQNISWVQRVLVFAAVIFVLEVYWKPDGIFMRSVEKMTVFILIPIIFVKLHGKQIGFHFDKQVLINTLTLSSIVLPFFILAGSLPVMRGFYPIGDVPLSFFPFVIHQFQQLILATGTEIFYRGVLCVWISEIGRKSVFVSPILYAYRHLGTPSPEMLASAPADVIFGWYDYDSNSIIPSIVAHWVGMILTDYFSTVDPLFPKLGITLQRILMDFMALIF